MLRQTLVNRRFAIWSLLAFALGGCGNASEQPVGRTHCDNLPRIPAVGARGVVTATPLSDISGYAVMFQGREWRAEHVDEYPRPLDGPAVVVSASPYRALLITPASGQPVSLPLAVLACG